MPRFAMNFRRMHLAKCIIVHKMEVKAKRENKNYGEQFINNIIKNENEQIEFEIKKTKLIWHH